ncbi:hypothetical protein GOP47_0022002 [Adiantum capillus-veneris]|uniref:30S ribosomal protein S31, chloroplastic n=1 Tax=Adiantum capillus-veneris TaxID=13818 RepID=A0A9D4U8S2_ADICA|nr:hypothetical protein GOP47_0022002 [Adiantum capillus-veneris]
MAAASSASVMASSVAPPAMMGFTKTICASSSLMPPFSCNLLPLQASSAYPLVTCGRGDKRTAKGKRFLGSYGNSRPRKPNKGRGLPEVPLPPRPPRKDPLDDGILVRVKSAEKHVLTKGHFEKRYYYFSLAS